MNKQKDIKEYNIYDLKNMIDKFEAEVKKAYNIYNFERTYWIFSPFVLIGCILLSFQFSLSERQVIIIETIVLFLFVLICHLLNYRKKIKKIKNKNMKFIDKINLSTSFEKDDSLESLIKSIKKYNINSSEKVLQIQQYFNSKANTKKLDYITLFISILSLFFSLFGTFNMRTFLIILYFSTIIIFILWLIENIKRVFRILDYDILAKIMLSVYINFDELNKKYKIKKK